MAKPLFINNLPAPPGDDDIIVSFNPATGLPAVERLGLLPRFSVLAPVVSELLAPGAVLTFNGEEFNFLNLYLLFGKKNRPVWS